MGDNQWPLDPGRPRLQQVLAPGLEGRTGGRGELEGSGSQQLIDGRLAVSTQRSSVLVHDFCGLRCCWWFEELGCCCRCCLGSCVA